MKFNWKILVAGLLVVVAAYWAQDSVRMRSYTGTNLSFGVGTGPVTVTNPSDQPVPVQLIGTGTRAFSVSSAIEGLTGSSIKAGSGSSTTQVFDFAFLPGINGFTITRGTNVNFVSNSGTRLAVTVQPTTDSEARTTLIIAAVLVLGGLFYISRTLGHPWLSRLRRQPVAVEVPVPVVETATGDPNRGRDGRMYSSYGSKD